MTWPSITPSVFVLALVLSSCAGSGVMSSAAESERSTAAASAATMAPGIPEDIDGAVLLAQRQRLSGDLNGANTTLSQLVLIAPDDPRVLGEYGKTLVDKGEANDALAFLQRAIQLQPGDWSFLSAQGVAFAQRQDYTAAQGAFSRALTLNPEAPVVLNNLALTHLQNGNLSEAEALLQRASVNGAAYPKIAQNLALVEQLRSNGASRATEEILPQGTPQPEAVAAIAAPATVESAPLPAPPAAAPRNVVMQALPAPDPAPAPALAAIAVEVSEPTGPMARTTTPLPQSGPIYFQVGAFASEENALRISDQLSGLGSHTMPLQSGERMLTRVAVGPFADQTEARSALATLATLGINDVHVLTSLPVVAVAVEPQVSAPIVEEAPVSDTAPQDPASPALRFSESL
jgi:Flp pilus assembly protein TadD